MAKLLVKALYTVAGTGMACAVPVGIFFGFGRNVSSTNLALNSATSVASENNPDSTRDSTVVSLSCKNSGKQMQFETPEGVDMNGEELQELLKEGLPDEDCES